MTVALRMLLRNMERRAGARRSSVKGPGRLMSEDEMAKHVMACIRDNLFPRYEVGTGG